ncbi:MuDR family transposase [Fagus crenata]
MALSAMRGLSVFISNIRNCPNKEQERLSVDKELSNVRTFFKNEKGLTESFKDVCPNMDHRACVRHIYANFRDSGHRGKALKDKLWAAASAYTKFEFDAHMAELKKLSPPAYEYLSKIPVATWSRSRFTKNPKSDLIVNNFSECFNSYILDVRDKPILTMIDTIRRKLMRRFQVNRASIAKMSGKLCPKIQVKVGKKKKSTDGAIGSAGDATSTAGGATSTAGATGTRSKGKKKAAGGATGATGTVGSSGTTAKYMLLEKGKKKSGGAGAAGTAVSGGVGGAVTADGGVGGAVTAAGGAGGAVTAVGGAVTAAGGAGGAVTAVGGAVTAAGGAVTAVRGAGTAAAGSRKAKVVVVPTVEKAMTRIAAKKQKK